MAQLTYDKLRPIGYDGQLATTEPHITFAMRNDDAGNMPFGRAVIHDSVSDETAASKLTAITGETVAGIVLKQESYADTQIAADGVLPGNHLNVLVRGRVLVVCEDGCNVKDRLHIRAVLAGVEESGALLAAQDGTDTIDATSQGVWLTSAAAGGLAWLEVDFTRKL